MELIKYLPNDIQINIYKYTLKKHMNQWINDHRYKYRNILKMIPNFSIPPGVDYNEYWKDNHCYQYEYNYKDKVDVLNWFWDSRLYTYKYIGSNKPNNSIKTYEFIIYIDY